MELCKQIRNVSIHCLGEGEAVKCAQHKLPKHGPCTCDISVTGELDRNACNQLKEKLGFSPVICFHKPSNDVLFISLLHVICLSDKGMSVFKNRMTGKI